METQSRLRFPLMALAALALLAGLWGGLVRMGWHLPPLQPAAHGPLMISGFLGTVISLERAVALSALFKARWVYAAPVFAGLGGLALLVGLPGLASRGLGVLASLVLVLIFVIICRLQLDWPQVTMGVGTLLWFAGNLLWLLGRPIFQVVP